MLVKQTCEEFISTLASDSPAPGGGSVSALSGALGTALVQMVIHLSVGKEQFKEHEMEFASLLEKTDQLKERLTRYVDEDTEAFNKVMAAFQQPKTTDKEKKERTSAIQSAMKNAADLPLAVAKDCLDIIELSEIVITKGNQNCISDGGVACLMAQAGLHGALMNVKINLGSIKDTDYVEHTKKEIGTLEAKAERLVKKIMAEVNQRLGD